MGVVCGYVMATLLFRDLEVLFWVFSWVCVWLICFPRFGFAWRYTCLRVVWCIECSDFDCFMAYCEFFAGGFCWFSLCVYVFVLVGFMQWLVMLLLCVVNFVGALHFGFIVGCTVVVVRCFGRRWWEFSLGTSF